MNNLVVMSSFGHSDIVKLTLLVTLLLTIQCTTPVSGQNYENVPDGAASLAFVFDITGSMYDDLVQVIEGAAKIMRTTLRRREKPLYNYVLVPFHDPDVGPVVVTSDPEDFQHELRNLYVQGGGDCPEMSITAIKEAIDVSLPNSFIYVFTDARSKDYYLTEEVLALVQKKQSQVVFVLTGDCDDPDHDGYKAYEQIASTSSGQVFLLKKSQVNEVLNFVRVAVQSRKVNLMSVDVLDSNYNQFSVPIDSQLQQITISVSGQSPKITLIDPSGNKVTPKTGLKKLLDINNALIVNVKRPLPGQWRLEVESKGKHTIRMTGLSSTDFSTGFSRYPVDTMIQTEHRPIGDIPTFMMINTTDLAEPAGYSRVELIDLQGRPLAEYKLTRDELRPNIYTVPSFIPPEDYFYVKVSGIDNKGYNIQRLTPTAITRIIPGPPDVWMPEVTQGYFGLTAIVTCRVNSLVPYTVRWFKEDVQLGTDLYFIDPDNATLEIPKANQFSEGIYFCNATNTAGTRRIPTFLDISEPPPSITAPQNVSVMPGETAILTCNVFSTVDYNITWYTQGYFDRLRSSKKFTDFNNGSLSVRNVGLDDEGMYTCRASNEGGYTEKNAFLRVQVPPIVKITPPMSNFALGDTRELACLAKGFPMPSVAWLRGDVAMIANEKVRLHGNKLTISNMQRGDAGQYKCIAINAAGVDEAEATLHYMESPVITLYDSRVLVASGDEAILVCAADGLPKPLIKWYKGDVELKALAYLQITDAGHLHIIGAQQLDAGQYRCEAVNEAGTDSAIVELEVGSDPTITQPPQAVGVDIGGNATLSCQADGSPLPKLFWQREDGRPLEKFGRATQLRNGDLFIQDVRVEDEGNYVCVAQNQFGSKDASAYLTITGIVAPLIGYMDPVIEVTQGEDLALNCQVLLGNPKPQTLWLHKGQVVNEDKHIHKQLLDEVDKEGKRKKEDGNIVIKDIQPEHSGNYQCFATNVGGNASFIVSVQVQVPPEFDYLGPEDEKVEFDIIEGDRVVLPCNVAGDPKPLITWYKDESPISLTDYHYFINEDDSLEIFSAEAGDTGQYRCQASNIAGEIEKVIKLFVQVPPTIDGEPSEEYVVVENQTIVLPCDISGSPQPNVTWRKNFATFEPTDERYVFGDYGMTIMDVKIGDKAFYECVAENVAGKETKIIVLVVQIPPSITTVGDTDQTVQKGDKVLLSCDHHGDPPPTVDWKKDETTLSVFDDQNGYELLETGSLLIESARVTQSGRYVCIVSNDAGVTTRDYTLTVQDPPSLPNNLTSYKDIIENNPVILRCPASGTPPPLITWYRDGALVTGDQLGISILEDGSLQISDTEAGDSARYKCIAENQAGKVEHEVELKVLVPPKLKGKDAGNEGVVDNPKVIVTNNVTLTCPVEADPPPHITWVKDGFELIGSSLDKRYDISPDGMQLLITNADVSDTARYTCIAENIAGETDKSFDLDVQVPPSVDEDTVSPSNNTVIKDNPVYLDCPVVGIPRPKVVWYKNDELITPSLDDNIRVFADGRRLEIIGARVSDTGKYTCVGENVAGKTEHDFGVDVLVPPKVDRPGEINIPEVVTNGTVTLDCPASGIPLPQITWYKSNQPISENTTQFTLLNNGWTLEITAAHEVDSARYTCRAKNQAGESEKAFDLNVLVPPVINRDNIVLTPKVVVNQTTVINCPADGKPPPVITWYKNGIPLDATVQPRYEIIAGGRQLRVKNAQLSDLGTYQCQAANKAGKDTVDFDLNIYVPSKIDPRRVNTNPKVIVDGSVTISCPASGVPPPTITWYKNGEEIVGSETSNVEIKDAGLELTITNAQVGDTARYTCRATNEAGESEISYTVDVQVPPSINKDDVNETPTVILDKSVVLDCPAMGVPEPSVIWLKDGLPIDFGNNPQFTLQTSGKRLSIDRASETDAALYTCVAANEAGSVEQTFDLDVWVKPDIDPTNIELNPTVIKGHPRVLYCPAEGNPTPDILWLKDGEPVQLDTRVEIQSGGLQLKINNATETDTAHYQCVARNPAGQASLSFDLHVHVSPSIDESNVVYFRKVVENRTILIECPVSGIPTPEVEWLINGHRLLPGNGLTLTHNNYHVEIASAQVSDTAVYTCVATNAAGELKKKFDLEVQVPPKLTPGKIDTELGTIQNQSVYIDCPITAIPFPSVFWIKDDEPLFDWPYLGLGLSNNDFRLEVVNAQPDDSGTYTCEANNPAGQLSVDFKLSVYVPPEISGSQFTSTVAVVKDFPVTLECVAYGVPEPQLAWIKNGEVIEIAENPHIRVLNNGRALQITKSDISDTGRYMCHAENTAGIAKKLYDLEVQVPPTITGLDKLQKVWVVINEPLTLRCPVQGIPPPHISWLKHGQNIRPFDDPSLRIQDDGQKLLLVSAQLLDIGDYTCYVQNEAGNDTLEYLVSVYVPPTIEDAPSTVQAVINTGATLLCESLGLPDPVITWKKDGQPFPNTGIRHRMKESGTIEFTSVRLADAGQYTCTAGNEAGEATQEVQLDVQVPPRMTGRQPLYLTTVENTGVLLPCEVTGTPSPRILWQKGTKAIRGKPGIDILQNGSLYLQQATTKDSGVYICIAQNSAGTAFGQIRLQVQVPPIIRVRETSFTVNNAHNIVLPCRATGRPRAKLTWEKDGVAILGSNPFLRLLRTGLAIPFARPEDAGTYTCIATNAAGSRRVDMILTVQVPPVIGEASRILTFTKGNDAEIQCAAIGIPPPTVEWLKEGRKIDTQRGKYRLTQFGNLAIRNLKEEDTGSYLCVATNIAGRDTQERLVRIQVPPSFIVVPQIQEVILNSRLELRCTADGLPTPTVHWMKNDVPIQSPSSVNGRSVYILHNARPEDGGVYTCLAQNPAGEAKVNTMVTVKVPPEILTPPGNKAVTIAERVILTCSVGGDPRPEVIWMKNHRPVKLSDRIQQLANGSLVIYRSTSSDAGEYKCVATNDAGTSEGVAMLTVREPPTFLIEPEPVRVDQGSNVRLDCVGQGEPTPKMDWMVDWDILQDKGRLSILPNNSLRIVAAQLSDSATYRCLAGNNLGKTFVEVNITVVVHGQWSVWSDWDSCSYTCGEGRQLRGRSCDNPEPANQGRPCTGAPVESKLCVTRQCPVSGNWGGWLPWEQCSVSCDQGERVRRRLCDNPRPQFGGEICDGDELQIEPCNVQPCSVDGAWSSWSSYQPCSTSCGPGLQEKTRSCDNPSPSNQGQYCQGSDTERQTCKLRECPVDGIWGIWAHWTACSVSCSGGTRTRARQCDSPAPLYGGLYCAGTDSQLDYCNNDPCPVHGRWSDWSGFGECSVSCGGGRQRRFRTCSDPAPSNNGQPCAGSSDDTESCGRVQCPVDGAWSDWSRWSACSQSCGKGTIQRQRTCSQEQHGGRSCRGDSVQVDVCQVKPCYTIPVQAEGNLIGFINNYEIREAKFSANMVPLPDNSATHVNATIRNVPSELVGHFRHLISVLSPVYWSTAMELDGAYNGYSLTGGDFNREVQVQFATGEILKMSQYAKGVDSEGTLHLDVVVTGNVPDIPESQVVSVTPYWEQYLQTGPGSVHALSTRMFHVDGHMLPYAWNHSIIYSNHDNKMPYLVQRLYARNMEISVSPEQEIVYYQLDTSIAPGSPSNQCPSGFTLIQDGPYCQDNDECSTRSPCSDYCHNSPGSFACSCPVGFALDYDGRQCIDIDECSTSAAGCQGQQQCINTIGSYRCEVRCGRGLRPSVDGQTCQDINECEERPGSCEQICVNRVGGYRCKCMPGYRRIRGGRCIDINECELSSSPCEQLCDNTRGSYTCSCRQGFEMLSQGRCRDINECEVGGATCTSDQNCVNSQGSYRCITLCPKGSTYIQGKCQDIDECRSGQHRCYINQRCVNTDPGYKCICPRGYRSSGPGTPCLDLNECRESPDICSYRCENTHGGYECLCPPGQVRLADKKSCAGLEFLEPARVIDTNEQTDEHTGYRGYRHRHTRAAPCLQGFVFSFIEENCIDLNECVDDPGICQHNCTNTIGSYKCSCPPGYRVSQDGSTCDDIDECLELNINCGADQMCFNTRGEFTCIDIPCPTNYQRDPITNYCVLECIDAEIACPGSSKYADVIEFRTLALPSGVISHQDLIRLIAYNQNNEILRKTVFTILKNDVQIEFQIRLEDGIGVVYTPQPLEDLQLYKIKVQAKSYDNRQRNIQYQTTFVIHIAVSAYPY